MKKYTSGFKVRGVNNKTGKVRYLKHEESGKRRQAVVWESLQDAKDALDVAMYQKWDDYHEPEWQEWGNALTSPWGQKDKKTTWTIVEVTDEI